ncbi:CPBP family intramembrane metalloprotease [Clostridium estertheticum]|uniref:CPBP family intramembrane glutamic endopeptidase n=1 Tax=Clostridium estertheticum TaxID=238834 RepID=UPI001CF1F0F9|nr:CPBP family intramembrane glutamic endopeptidase [Clostridium estertheticum]MCB2308263.1 CPBP family intramembrane metalloprotease [Clostridium estertheticum]MCB2346387.1 CPBP family intramembrane metalloprotease [Clostridium estertheticum]MCB2350842.1 CPBP family intramembrane metalloprotease [Clostridium estertheticum]WAG44841.1 CPBP family intramembrane metalloprotease [Clostridium estertheticum]
MKEKKSVIAFLIITFMLSSIIYVIWIMSGEAATRSGISVLLMWCPAVATFIVCRKYYKKENLLGLNKCKLSFILTAIVVPMVYLGLSYGIYWLINKESFAGDLNMFSSVSSSYTNKLSHRSVVTVITLVIGIFTSIITATGEEIGWRGFLLPQLTKIWNIKVAVIVSGLIWAAWHMPIMIAGLYLPGTPLWFKLPMFVIEVIAITVIMSVLRLESNSVWPAILLHASHNYFDQAIFGTLTNSINKSYYVGETGIITVIVSILVAIITVMLLKNNDRHEPVHL